MKQIREWLGHSDISTTANIYAHLDSQSKQLSAATMEQALPLPGELPKAGGKMMGKRNPRGKPLGFWRSIRDLNSGGAVNALSHFEFCVPNAVCAPPGSKQAVLSGLF